MEWEPAVGRACPCGGRGPEHGGGHAADGHGDRCAKSFSKTKTVEYETLLAEKLENGESDDIILLDKDGQLELDELLGDVFILDLDTKNLCSEDCKGLCPGCGADLNVEPCRCKKEVDPRLAKLAQLLEQDN